MEIEEIQHDEKTDNTEIRFCDDDLRTLLTINLSRRDMFLIAEFCRNELSYGAQLRRAEKQYGKKHVAIYGA